ncbi:polysaccharide biosynthesis protein [Micromonospora chaiyaphumensis]|uniref:Membrane protein involved in the export of O-antigen and teichoic acid n=1 Tax=Micromonospora chaiyaphumensis TaxID=307119 RepID=A0A1C4YBW0_9ACTN|nr:polysaccharide biosynthesis protein [Micromonospora chaiyaphumensis]SCF18213.1 Membrane protein involved in the export of O-antigen and teichoic acid [Micromonospora chaiyaphumensis]
MTETTAGPGAGRLGAAGAAVAGAAMATNGLAYLLPMLGARYLAIEELSVLATVLALVAIAGVAGVGLQMAIAVHRARHPGAPARRVALVTTAAAGGAVVVAAPLVMTALRLSPAVVALVAGTTVAVVLAGRWLGELQGEQRFLRLAWAMGVVAVGRYGGMIVALVLGADVVATLVTGMLTAYLVLPVLAWVARPTRPAVAGDDAVVATMRIRQVTSAGAAALAMLAVSYADLIFARQLLSPADSGAYAVGTVLTKGALWAPQVIVVLALPRLAVGDNRVRTVVLAIVAACGAVLVAASALAGGFAFRLVGGEDYASLGEYAPFFAATGALYALVFAAVNAKIAAGARWPSAPLWVGAGVLAVLTMTVASRTFQGIMWCALATAAGTALVMVFNPPPASRAAADDRSSPPDRAAGLPRSAPAGPPG